MKKHPPHRSLAKLRHFCGKTALQFASLTGVSYDVLVANEQGKRLLSEDDAMLISAATGVDPAFNAARSGGKILTVYGLEYGPQSFRLWQDQDLPGMRETLAHLRHEEGEDVMASVLCANLRTVVQVARVQGRELAVCGLLARKISEVIQRFGLAAAIPEWHTYNIKFDHDPADAKAAALGAVVKAHVKISRSRKVARPDLMAEVIQASGIIPDDNKAALLASLGKHGSAGSVPPAGTASVKKPARKTARKPSK